MAPTIVLLPGMWHGPSGFEPLRKELSSYETVTDRLPCTGASDPSKLNLHDDTKYVRESILMPLVDEGKDIVVVMHSYSGMPGSAAVEGLNKEARAKEGKKGGVIGLIFFTALLVPVGQSVMTIWEQNAPGYTNNYCTIAEDFSHTYVKPEPAQEYFYNDLPPEEAARWVKEMETHTAGASMAEVTYVAWDKPEWKDKCRYIDTPNDKAVPHAFQKTMSKDMKSAGSLDTGHSSYIAKPKEVAKIIEKCIKEFEA